MGKSIANLYRYAEISKAANNRFLNSMHNIVPKKSVEKEINAVCERKTVKGKTITGFNVWCRETFLLFECISEGKYLIKGFTNRDIREDIGRIDSVGKTTERNRMSRTLFKLRSHGLVKKVPHSRRYLVTDKGRRIMGALIETKRKTYPEQAAVL